MNSFLEEIHRTVANLLKYKICLFSFHSTKLSFVNINLISKSTASPKAALRIFNTSHTAPTPTQPNTPFHSQAILATRVLSDILLCMGTARRFGTKWTDSTSESFAQIRTMIIWNVPDKDGPLENLQEGWTCTTSQRDSTRGDEDRGLMTIFGQKSIGTMGFMGEERGNTTS
jgi:hypothetical protein